MVQQSGTLAKLYKYNYSSASESFSLVVGFPVDLPLSGLATVVAMDQDSTGKLWATYTSASNVFVVWSTSADHVTWDTAGFVLAPDISSLTTEAAAITHFGGNKIGILWGNQNLGEYAFRFHGDGEPENVWSAKEVVDCCGTEGSVADDHLSLRAAPDGRLFAVLKDSIGAGHLHLYVRAASGPWGQKVMIDSDTTAQPTRPALALDIENNHAYVVYRNSTDSQTYLSRTSMDSLGFGLRCVFLTHGTSLTSTKQFVNSNTGLVAADSDTGQIFPARIDLAAAAATTSEAESAGPAAAPTRQASAPAGNERIRTQAASTAAAAAGSALQDGTPVPGFDIIWAERLSTSETPANDSEWWWLRQKRVNTIVNLDAVPYDFARYGFDSFLWTPLEAGQAPTDAAARKFLKFVQSCDNEPAHISGGARNDRATLVALLRYAVDARPIARAISEAQRSNGGAPLSPEQIKWLLRWAAKHAPGSERLNSCRAL
jgi:hypothetical protein